MNEQIKKELQKLAEKLEGTLTHQIIVDSYGKCTREVIITYPENK